jgi:hypothetical protein
MSKATFTPGPWQWIHGAGDTMPKIVGANGEKVCDFGDATQYYPTEGDPPVPADRYLMIASPDLFDAALAGARYSDALRKLQQQGFTGSVVERDELDKLFMDWHDKTHAAIAKATGEAPT